MDSPYIIYKWIFWYSHLQFTLNNLFFEFEIPTAPNQQALQQKKNYNKRINHWLGSSKDLARWFCCLRICEFFLQKKKSQRIGQDINILTNIASNPGISSHITHRCTVATNQPTDTHDLFPFLFGEQFMWLPRCLSCFFVFSLETQWLINTHF